MQTIRMALRLEPHQAKRLEKVAEQCGLTPEQMDSTIAVLALNHQLGEPHIPAAQPTEQSLCKRLSPESTFGSSVSYALPDTGFLRLTEIVGPLLSAANRHCHV